MRPIIDWSLISKALEFYKERGFTYIETPWFVSEEALIATLSEEKGGVGQEIEDGYLVGSAEQGFYQMMLDGSIQPGRYVSASPCHREDEEDEIHYRSFFKVELIEIFGTSQIHGSFANVAEVANEFFMSLIPGEMELNYLHTPQGIDILLGDVEIGSYGIRRNGLRRWAYGTGIAEPRLSSTLRKALSK